MLRHKIFRDSGIGQKLLKNRIVRRAGDFFPFSGGHTSLHCCPAFLWPHYSAPAAD
jgi:hypothetical protein